VRFAGIPSGYEFSSFIQDLLLVSGRDSGLRPETRAFLQELRQRSAAGLRHSYLTLLPASRDARSPDGAGKPVGGGRDGRGDRISRACSPAQCQRRPQTTINHGAGTVVGSVPEDHLIKEIRSALSMGQG